MAGQPSNQGNRVLFERLEPRALLSVGLAPNPPSGWAGSMDYAAPQVIRSDGMERMDAGASSQTIDPRVKTSYDPVLFAPLSGHVLLIADDGGVRVGFGPGWHGDSLAGMRDAQGSYGGEFRWRDGAQVNAWAHSQLPRSQFVGDRTEFDSGYSADNGLGPPQVQRLMADLAAYASSGSSTVVTLVILPIKPGPVIARGDEVEPPPPSNGSPAPTPLPQLSSQSQGINSVPQPAQAVPSVQPQTTTASANVIAPTAAPVVPISSRAALKASHVTVETVAVPTQATGGAPSIGDQPTASVGTFAIVVPRAAGTIGMVSAAPAAGTSGAIATATAWVRSATAVVKRAFEGPLPDAPEAATFLTPAAYNLLRLNPAALFNDPIARIIGESATLSAQGSRPTHARAWAITGSVIAADAILVGYWHLERRRKARAAQKRRPVRLFSASPVT